jgi:superfamily II DNA helicase RecQ
MWNAEQALSVLRQMHGPDAAYNSYQGKAIRAVISNRLQVVVVLATGQGKSLLYQLPARLPGAGTTLLIVPLVALKQDTIRKCKQLGVDCSVWSSHQQPSPGCPLVLVSLDQAVQTPFLTFANQLNAAGLLARVVIDESHLVCTAESYRRRMREVKQLRMLHCQFVFLTATLAPQMEPAFEEALLLQRPLYIRSATIRTDLEYYVVRVEASQTSSFELSAASLLQGVLQQDWFVEEGVQARALVFVRTKQQADVVAHHLGCSKYYSDSATEEDKATILTQWIEGKPNILVATSALAGVDYRHVRAVFHIGEPIGGAIDFAQDVGRVGRDGLGGLSVTFIPAKWQAQYNTEAGALLPSSIKAIQRYLDAPRCRMIPLSEYLDGKVQSCKKGSTACDRCTSQGLLSSRQGQSDGRATQRQEHEHKQEQEQEQEQELGFRSGSELEPMHNQDEDQDQDQDQGPDLQQGEDYNAGPLLIQQYNRQTAQQLQRFIHGLNLLQGSCILCRFLDNKRGQNIEHSLDQCGSRFRQGFLSAKTTAIQQGKRSRSGWLARFGACYSCGNIQAVCSSQGQGNCKYKDLIMPLCWSILHRKDWATKVLIRLPQGLLASRNEGRYMLWLGEKATVFEEQGTNLALIADRVIQEVLLGV